MSEITYYKNSFGNTSVEVDLHDMLKAIKSGKWKDKVQEYRKMIVNGKTEQSDNYKRKQVPGFTTSGTFPNSRKASELGTHSGFIAMDFDDVDLSLREELYADDYTYAGFISIGGSGICIIVKIEPSKHFDAFKALEHYYFTKYGEQIDPACKDVSRLRYVSYDPELFINPNAKQFKSYLSKPKGRKPKINPVISSDSNIEFVLKQIEADRKDLTADYQAWVELAFAFQSEYGETGEEYFHRVSQFHPDYDYEKTSKKYRACKSTGSGISIATFYHYAKQAGCRITSPETSHISKVAVYAKKGRRTVEQAINQLATIDNLPPEKTEKIVKEVFKNPELATADDEEDIVSQIEDMLKREFKIVYNEVTLKYEQNNEPLTDRDFNSIFIHIKKVIPKASKDLVLSCIDSEITQVRNPILEWFRKNKDQGTGYIKTLAETIDTPTGFRDDNFFPEYSYYFIRKWMIGAVAMWHKKHSPLMLVLAGAKQNTGKTYWFRYLLPDELQPYYAESELTGDKDENLLMCNKMIIMNDEMSNKSRKDIAVMKQLCSKQWFNLRKPYGKLSEDFRRIATLAGTSNNIEILSDPTGNRRIIPIEVNLINHELYNSIDKSALWMEAYTAFMSGEQYHLSNEDISKLTNNTNEFEESSLERELIMKFFRKPKANEKEQLLAPSEIKAYIEVRTHQKLNLGKLGMELKKLGYEQKKAKVDGSSKRVYPVIEIPVSTVHLDKEMF